MIKLSIFVLLILSSQYASCEDTTHTIVGTGSGFAYIIQRAWSLTYSNEYPHTHISYIPNESIFQNVTDTILLPNYGATELPLTNQTYVDYPDVSMFPLSTGAIVLLTNIQNFTEIFTPLTLSRETTVRIFTGDIQYWDDPSIVADNINNTDVVNRLPHAPIQIIIPRKSSLTVVFTTALESFSSNWNGSHFLSWPQNITNNWIRPPIYTTNAFDTLTKVLSLNNTIAYVPYSIALFVQASYAKMINKAGNVVSADTVHQQAAQESAVFDKKHFANILDAPGEDAWPLTMFTYALATTRSYGNCTEKRETLKYFVWALHDEAGIIGDTLGFTRLPEDVKQMTLDILESFECGGNKILSYEYLPQHTSAIPEAIFWINMILLAATIAVGIALQRLGGFATKILAIYTGLVIAGAIISYISAIFWYLVPTENWICSSRFWLSTMGFTLLLAAMFARTWQFYKLYNTFEVKGKLTSKVFGWFEYTGGIGLIVIIQLLILIVKQAVDPWNAAITVTNDIEYEAVWKCNSSYDTIWVYLEVSFFSLLLLFGLYVVYRTWSWDGMRTESRWLLISIYNVIFVGLSVQLLAAREDGMTDDSLGLYAQIMIAITTSNMVCAVTFPMFFTNLWKKIQATFTTVSVTDVDLMEKARAETQNPPPSWSNNSPSSSPSVASTTTSTTSYSPSPPVQVRKQTSSTPTTAPSVETRKTLEPPSSSKPFASPSFRSEFVPRHKPN